MIIFKKIRWKNLLSTGNTWIEIDLNSHQTTLIVGENGAGKSTLLDAISLALYGRPFRKINKPQLLNTINNRDCVVELFFDIASVEYMVRRGIKPTVFDVFRDDELLNQDSDSTEYQDYFEKHILKMNHKSFNQIVILGSASFVPFMQLAKAARREVIEDLLNIQIFSTMNLLLKDKVTNNKEELFKIDTLIDGAQRNIDAEKRRALERKHDAQGLIKGHRTKIDELHIQIMDMETVRDSVQSQADDLRGDYAGMEDSKKRYGQMSMLLAKLQTKRDGIISHMKFMDESGECYACKQSITEDAKKKAHLRDSEISELSQAIDQMEKKIKAEHDAFQQMERSKVAAEGFLSVVRDCNTKITLWKGLIDDIEVSIVKLKTTTTKKTIEVDLVKAEAEYKEFQSSREGLINERALNDVASILLKDSGIKTRIVRQYIPIINRLVNKYLASMDFFVNFELDETFTEKVKSRFRDEFTYDSFSEGEKARLDLALLFTWRAIAKMRNSAPTNLLILDEVFDGSLNAAGGEELLKILNALDNNIFVISHKTDAYLDKFQRVIKFEKQKSFSRIVEAI